MRYDYIQHPNQSISMVQMYHTC